MVVYIPLAHSPNTAEKCTHILVYLQDAQVTKMKHVRLLLYPYSWFPYINKRSMIHTYMKIDRTYNVILKKSEEILVLLEITV